MPFRYKFTFEFEPTKADAAKKHRGHNCKLVSRAKPKTVRHG